MIKRFRVCMSPKHVRIPPVLDPFSPITVRALHEFEPGGLVLPGLSLVLFQWACC